MSDLSELKSSISTKIAGADATGSEQVFVQASTAAPAGTEGALIVRNIPSGIQAVSGTVSVGNFPATQAVSGTVSVSNFPSTFGRAWTLASATDTVGAVQSGTWTVSRNWTLSGATDSVDVRNITGTVPLPTGASTSANQTTQLTSLQLIDDIVHAAGEAINKVAAIGAQFDDVSTTAAVEDKIAALRMTAQRAMHSNLRDAQGNEISSLITAPVGTERGLVVHNIPSGIQNSSLMDKTGLAIDAVNSGGLNALNFAMTATNFVLSTANSTVVQLAVGATFTGTIETIFNQQAISVILTSDQNGILTLIQYIDEAGTRKTSSLSFPILHDVPFSRCIQGNGNYFNLTFKNSGSATSTTLNINTAYGTLASMTALANGPVSIDEINGIPATARADGFLRQTSDPSTLLFENFETLDTTNVWTVGGTTLPTGGSGNLSLSAGTAANAKSFAKTLPAFSPGSAAYLQYESVIQVGATLITGNKRFWGIGVFVTPTLTVPITNGCIYEIDEVTGKLFASVYSNSIRTQTAVLVKPIDAQVHKYEIYYTASKVFFEIENIVVATFDFPNPQVSALSAVIGSVNGPSVLGTAPMLNASTIGIGDTAKNNIWISDPKYPWRRTTVNADGSLTVAGNVASGGVDSGNPLKIGGVYNSILPTVTTGQRVDLQLDSNGRLLTSSLSTPTPASKFSFGDVSSTLPVEQVVYRTAYTEPATSSTMTIVSSSASDTAAGTGARTITITYLDATMNGPFNTTATLNGTTPVSLVSGMRFIEKMIVNTVGSNGSNVGTLTLKTAGGANVGTISAGEIQTFWAHHYVPVGKTSYVSGFSLGSSSSATGAGATYVLKVTQPTLANAAEYQASDFVTLFGQSSTITRSYISPIQIIGPARVRAYATPQSSTVNVYRASFDYIDN